MTYRNKLSKGEIIFGITLLLLFILGFFLYSNFDLDNIRKFIQSLGLFAPLGLIIIMAIAIIISPIPSLPLSIISGLLFGGLLGGIYAVIGAAIGALIAFFIGKKLGRDLMQKYMEKELKIIDNIDENYLTIFILIARLLPIFHFDILSYGAGLTKISPWKFLLATIVGMMPATFALAFSGEVIFTNIKVSIIVTLVFIVLPFLFIHKIPKWLKKK